MIVVFAAEAEADLEAIGDYIARDNPVRAITFVEELVAAAERIAEAPNAFPLTPRYERLGVRRRVCGEYLIFYRIETKRIVVLHILHGARDYESILFPG